jgi:S-DNA-T family DNA segregation ATPase FtsK/SpoIIIE
MAKKKTRKETKKEPNNYVYELIGFLLILISIVGFMNAGIVGRFIKSFATFLVGTWYAVLFLSVIVVGVYMMLKRKKPDFITAKLVGLYIFMIGVLLASHINYLASTDLKGLDIIGETVNNFMVSNGNADANLCGGILGAIFSCLFLYLFDLKGTKIVIWALIICGIVMFTGVSVVDLLKKLFKNMKEKTSNIKIEKKPKSKESEPVEEENKKIIVSSIDELIHIADDVEEKEVIIEEEPTSEEKDQYRKPAKYSCPPMSLLSKSSKKTIGEPKEVVAHNVETLERVLNDFGIVGHVVAINPGPAVTQYELEVKSGTKISKVAGLNKELALALAAKDIRIEAPIPGKSTIGIEIPNTKIAMVSVREILESVPEKYKNSKLLVTLGKDIMGKPSFCEINKTPHLLVAGSTGSGKSVCINSFIVSILMRAKPDEVKLVLVDPKKVEFSMYNGVPHLLAPVVTDPKKASIALKKIVVEMERRYEVFSNSGTKNFEGYNKYVEEQNQSRSDNKIQPLPYIVVIIDELADLMLVAAKEVEDSIMRITQMARAAGIHLIVATQRPSTDVITGVVKSNIPARISFAVSSSIDSRTILDLTGAEKLLGKGDMLYKPQDANTPTRIQGTFISDEEIKKVVDYTIKQQKAQYDETLLMDSEEMGATTMVEEKDATEEPLYNEIVEFVVSQQKASTSLLQRRFRLGYNRAARAIDLLEERGIVGPANGSKPREVYVKLEDEKE